MRSSKRPTDVRIKSKSRLDIILTVEEAEEIAAADPAAISKLETFLSHHGFTPKVDDGSEEKEEG